MDVEAALACPVPDPLPTVLYGHWHTASGGQCDCYGPELQLSYGSVAYTDFGAGQIAASGNAWYVDQVACDEIIRWVLYRSADGAYHMQLQRGYPFDGFALTDAGGFCFDTLDPVSGLALFAGNSLCVFGEFGEFGVTFDESPAHHTDVSIFAHYSAGGKLTVGHSANITGNYSAGGDMTETSFSRHHVITAAASINGNLPSAFATARTIEGGYSGGGSLVVVPGNLVALDCAFSVGGSLT